mmetsp:Transcript_16626/g.33653  ORF Transcript_16626/g.33653 Transcript_16626/m.33653 type:complete len:200 (+) Transcript_16626:1347-1946(+)
MQIALSPSWDWESARWVYTPHLHLGPTALLVPRFLHPHGACLQLQLALRQQLARHLAVGMESFLFDQSARTCHGDLPAAMGLPGDLFHPGILYLVPLCTQMVGAGGPHLRTKAPRKVVHQTQPRQRGLDQVLVLQHGARPRRTAPSPMITRTAPMWWVLEEIDLALTLLSEWKALDAGARVDQQKACLENWLWQIEASH